MTDPQPAAAALDLCDRCGAVLSAEGYRATLGARTLLLCKVHIREHRPRLEHDGWTVELLALPEPTGGPLRRGTCSCGNGAAVKNVTTHLPGTSTVEILKCVVCDTRTCDHETKGVKCGRKVPNGSDPICSGGHSLMPEATR